MNPEQRPLYICRYCEDIPGHFVGKMILYTCAKCVKERETIEAAGGKIDEVWPSFPEFPKFPEFPEFPKFPKWPTTKDLDQDDPRRKKWSWFYRCWHD